MGFHIGAGSGGTGLLGQILGPKAGSQVGGALEKTDPWNIFHQKKKVDTAGPMPGSGAPGAAAGLTYKSLLDASGNLPDSLKSSAHTVTADQVTAPAAVTADKVAAPDAVTAATYNADTTDVAGPDQAALNALKSRAMSQGDSPWAAMQKQQNELSRLTQADQAGASALGASDMARSELAMRGGLESGASERIAENSARDLNANRAGINRAAQGNALGIGIADDQTKMSLLSQIPGMDLANANFNLGQAEYNTGATNAAHQFNAGAKTQADEFNVGTTTQVNEFNAGASTQANEFNTGLSYDASKTNAANALNSNEFNANANDRAGQFNIGNIIAGINGENTFDMSKYGIDMGSWAAGKQSDALANAGKK